jgi:hypothetical protein
MFISGAAISAAPISAALTSAVPGLGRGRPGSGDDDRRRRERQRYAARHRRLARQRADLIAATPKTRSRWWPFTRKSLEAGEDVLLAHQREIVALDGELARLEAIEAALFLVDEEEALVLLMGST